MRKTMFTTGDNFLESLEVTWGTYFKFLPPPWWAFMVATLLMGTLPLHAEAPGGRSPATNLTLKIVVDTTEVPELEAYGRKVQALSMEWYPRIAAALPSEGYTAPDFVQIYFKKTDKGVAYTTGNHIVCSSKWFIDHPDDLGAIVHELTHVVQHFTKGKRPGWLVEGSADYIRFFIYEPPQARPHPRADRSKYSDSYRTTAAFLDWASRTYDKDLVVQLNAACRNAQYTDELWKTYTGKSLEALGAEWNESLKKPEKPQ